MLSSGTGFSWLGEKAYFALVRLTKSRENPDRENAMAKKTNFHLQMSI